MNPEEQMIQHLLKQIKNLEIEETQLEILNLLKERDERQKLLQAKGQ